MSDAPFVSVKLPAALVNQAREAAQTMRRSVASQVEYWATLGKALEHAGLTTGDSQALIARQERAPFGVSPRGAAAVAGTGRTAGPCPGAGQVRRAVGARAGCGGGQQRQGRPRQDRKAA